jgi:hypothetical protein
METLACLGCERFFAQSIDFSDSLSGPLAHLAYYCGSSSGFRTTGELPSAAGIVNTSKAELTEKGKTKLWEGVHQEPCHSKKGPRRLGKTLTTHAAYCFLTSLFPLYQNTRRFIVLHYSTKTF